MNLMKKICEELENIEKDFLLTDTQKAILLLTHISETPQQAFETTSGTENSTRSRNLLQNLGMVTKDNKKLFLTKKGDDLLINYNLIDDMGELTELGIEILDNYKKNYDSVIKTESISFIKEII